MMNQAHTVCVYIFDRSDGRTPQERLALAVGEYCRECGMEDVLQALDWESRCNPQNANIREDEQDAGKNAERGILRVEKTETGKPYFPDCPRIQFSISHSGAYWACAIAGEPVGLDLQEHTLAKGESRQEAAVRFQKMAHRFFHPLEAEFVELDCYNHFFTVWAAREAYVKFTGQGIDKYFSEHCVVPEESMWRQMSGQTEKEILQHCVAGAAEKEKVHSTTSGQAEEVTWQAYGKWFWKTEYANKYTLCVCTEAACECGIVEIGK